MRTKYQRDTEDFWVIQFRKKNSTHVWHPYLYTVYGYKASALDALGHWRADEFDPNEYRIRRYRPVGGNHD